MDNPKQKWVFIINPVAGNVYAKTIVPKLEEMIKVYNIDADLVYSERSKHAVELSEMYFNKGYRNIIGVGGDGTLNEIARPLVNKKDVTIGIIPSGTGNDFIQILGFPNRFEEKDWETFFKVNVKAIDAGTCNGLMFQWHGTGL